MAVFGHKAVPVLFAVFEHTAALVVVFEHKAALVVDSVFHAAVAGTTGTCGYKYPESQLFILFVKMKYVFINLA